MGIHRSIATANELIVIDGGYTAPRGHRVDLAGLIADARAGTRAYDPTQTARILTAAAHNRTGPPVQTVFELTPETSSQAAARLAGAAAGPTRPDPTAPDPTAPDPTAPSPIAVLNFASARNPGGGYLRGARSQEEDLCRSSALYTTLCEAPAFYAAHRADRDLRYTHRVIHSPDVPVYRDHRLDLLDEPFTVSFVTSPAPNAGQLRRHDATIGDAELAGLIAERAARVLAVAHHHGNRTLVLGAWGCGVFGNDPHTVAGAFRGHLLDGGVFTGAFDRIVFAVPDAGAGRANSAAFRSVFADIVGP